MSASSKVTSDSRLNNPFTLN